eukprot:CFRG1489T1
MGQPFVANMSTMRESKLDNFAPIIRKAKTYGDKVAIMDVHGAYSYNALFHNAASLSHELVQASTEEKDEVSEPTIAFMTPRDYSYAATMYATWLSGAIAVPLCTSHPAAELEYVIRDSNASLVVSHPDYENILRPIAKSIGIPFIGLSSYVDEWKNGRYDTTSVQSERSPAKNALIIYTSGTTGKPKGVLSSHINVDHQIRGLVEAWQWQASDHLLHVLPLHHVHGVVVGLLSALYSGATCELHPAFCEASVFNRLTGLPTSTVGFQRKGVQLGFLAHDSLNSQLNTNPTIFMAVPTIYSKLLQTYRKHIVHERSRVVDVRDALLQRVRLMTCGSAPLPITVMEEWEKISGHKLLERYGMTETGIVLTNPYVGDRVPASVGSTLLGVEARVVKYDDKGVAVNVKDGVSGELLIRGEGVFKQYWKRNEATNDAFVDGEWFMTGDEAIKHNNGTFRILGRISADILKTGGYKVSALEIENILLEHPDILECVVYGVPDEVWGDRVTAMVVTDDNSQKPVEITELRDFAKTRLAEYKLPSRLVLRDSIPRNAMGKVNKKALVADKRNW